MEWKCSLVNQLDGYKVKRGSSQHATLSWGRDYVTCDSNQNLSQPEVVCGTVKSYEMSAYGQADYSDGRSDHVECAAFDNEFAMYGCSSVRNKNDTNASATYSPLQTKNSDERYKRESLVEDNNLNTLCDLLEHEVRWRHGHPWYSDLQMTRLNDGTEDGNPLSVDAGENVDSVNQTDVRAVLNDLLKLIRSHKDGGETSGVSRSDDVAASQLIEPPNVKRVEGDLLNAGLDCICYSDCVQFQIKVKRSCTCNLNCLCNYHW